MNRLRVFVLILLGSCSLTTSQGGRHRQTYQHQNHANHRDFGNRLGPIISAASQHISQVTAGYHYPLPASTNVKTHIQPAPSNVEIIAKEKPVITTPATTILPPTTTTGTQMTAKPKVMQVPASLVNNLINKKQMNVVIAQATSSVTQSSSSSSVTSSSIDTTTSEDKDSTARLLEPLNTPQIQKIDVACGKEKMTVRATFDREFNGVIYAKGHYNDQNCRYTAPNQGLRVYQFEMVVGQCGASFIDSGLKDGGQAYVDAVMVVIHEPGVQEAFDAARRIRCLWEGSIDQTVSFPLSLSQLDSQTLTFSGDTATANLQIQNGRGPRAPQVQGLVRVGELLTAVVTVQGDSDFDLLIRNCVATDGTPSNRIVLSDNRGCAAKPGLMGGWQKQRNSGGNVAAYAYLKAFKFPDVMDLFLECTVSLCKGVCDECPEYLELHVPTHDEVQSEGPATNEQLPDQSRRLIKRSASNYTFYPEQDSLRLRRVVRVIGPDDLPDLPEDAFVYGQSSSGNDCFTVKGIMLSVALTFFFMITLFLTMFGILRRQLRHEKC